MTQREIAKWFGINERTLIRYKQAKKGSWRNKIYWLIIEEANRQEKLAGAVTGRKDGEE